MEFEVTELTWPQTGLFERFLKQNGQAESCGRKEKHLVVKADQNIVGGFRLCPFYARDPQGKPLQSVWLVRNMLVVDAMRGQGLGHLLLEALQQRAPEMLEGDLCFAFPWQWLQKFYTGHGFIEITEIPQPLQQVWKGLQNANRQVDAMVFDGKGF